MSTDFRALCAELEDAYTWCIEEYMTDPAEEDTLILRARAALAQPESVAPTVMEILELHSWLEYEWRANNDGEDLPMVDFARAVLARWGNYPVKPDSSPANNTREEN
jgi:hypothetical protein